MNEKQIKIGDLVERQRHNFPFLSDDQLRALVTFDLMMRKYDIPFLVTGSMAWAALGLPLERKVKDFDVQVICSEEQEEIFRNIAEAQGSTFHQGAEEVNPFFKHKAYAFVLCNVEFNVWVDREKFYHTEFVQRGGILFPTINSLIDIKVRYHREKDLKDILGVVECIIAKVTGPGNLSKFINLIDLKGIEETILKDDERELD